MAGCSRGHCGGRSPASTDSATLLHLLDPTFGIPADVTFTIIDDDQSEGVGEVSAHKLVLGLKSTVLKRMFFTPGEKQELEVRTSLRAFQLMVRHVYGGTCRWEGVSLLDMFHVAFLATRYHLAHLMEEVVAGCAGLPVAGEEVEAASAAEEFMELFPRAAGAVMEACTSSLASSLLSPSDVAMFAARCSESSMGPTALRLLDRVQRVKENHLDMAKEDQLDIVNKNQLDMVKENQVDKVKENQLDMVKEQLEKVKGNQLDVVKENQLGLVKEEEQVLGTLGLVVLSSHTPSPPATPPSASSKAVAKPRKATVDIEDSSPPASPQPCDSTGDSWALELDTSDPWALETSVPDYSTLPQPVRSLKLSPLEALATSTKVDSTLCRGREAAMACRNCGGRPCRHGQEVREAALVPATCRLLSTKRGLFARFPPLVAEVVEVRQEGKVSSLKVKWEGEGARGRPTSALMPLKWQKASFTFHCSEVEVKEEVEETKCANCGEAPCLHQQQVAEASRVPLGCRLLSCKGGYFRGMAPTLATVVAVNCSNMKPVKVRWERGGRKEQKCPLPSTPSHRPTFTYHCREEGPPPAP